MECFASEYLMFFIFPILPMKVKNTILLLLQNHHLKDISRLSCFYIFNRSFCNYV